MKKRIYTILLLTGIGISSCQKLDREFVTDLSKDQIDISYERSTQLLNAVYAELREGFQEIDGAMMASATDEAEHALETSTVQNLNNGSWSANNNPNNVWPALYRGIRRANLFLESAGRINLDLLRLDPSPSQQQLYKERNYEIARWNLEARYLRAMFYFELIKRYGGVPLITTTLTTEDVPQIKRSSLEECIKFIVSECEFVATQTLPSPNGQQVTIPVSYPSGSIELGRATRGAALALKSRVTLYAASQLFNDPSWASGYAQPELISLPGGTRSQRWSEAADAAQAVMTAYGTNNLSSTYPNLFNATNFNQSEIIFSRRNIPANTFEQANFPVGLQGRGGTNPSQNLVDAYEIRQGSGAAQIAVPFDWNNPDHVANIYNTSANATANTRDPRLNFAIAVNDRQLTATSGFNRNLQIANGGLDGKPLPGASKTGYYLKKYINATPAATAAHSWVYFRMAEIFLNYAEAKNELGDQATALEFINKVRNREGVKMPLIPAGLDQAQMRRRIEHERMVEFAFEDHRAWDVRRWMIAPQTLGAPLRGVQIERISANSFSYLPMVVEQRVFTASKMYLYPIPESDILTSPGLVQNPGW